MNLSGTSIGVIGSLNAFPLRVAARLVAEHGGHVHRGTPRGTTMAVICRSLLLRPAVQIEEKVAAARAVATELHSEDAFTRLLRRGARPQPGTMSRQSLLEQSGLAGDTFDLLGLFDAFEHDAEPFSFRDLILARKYAGLIATGASWYDIAKAVHSVGPVSSLTAMSLETRGERIVAQDRFSLTELDGQRLLPLPEAPDEAEDFFAHAENAEAAGLHAEAAVLYGHCAALDRSDATAPFNQGNCLRESGDAEGSLLAYATSLKRDGSLVDTWFNCAHVLRSLGRIEAARLHLSRAVALDSSYADAVYNLAALEYDAGDLDAAATYWRRYLELDDRSDWANRARAGLAIVYQMRKRVG
jgi:tetratricopeptide (TPR) repeat protein